MTVQELIAALRRRYREPAWALFTEVPNATGWGAVRTADAIAFGVWPSQGLELHGFEIKVSRSDWLREIKRPEKADKIMAYCDRTWIVAGEKGIVDLQGLPPIWGLLEPHGDDLRATKTAERNPAAKALDRHFLASLMRQAFRYIEHQIAEGDGSNKAYERGVKDGKLSAEIGLARLEREAASATRNIEAFERASGVRINDWNGKQIGEAVRSVMSRQHLDFEQKLRRLKEAIDSAVTEFDVSAAAAS